MCIQIQKAGSGLSIRRAILAVLIILVLSLLAGCGERADRSVDPAFRGMMDLRASNLSESVVKLNGEWEFHWRQFPDPAGNPVPNDTNHYLQVPHSWNGYDWEGMKLPGAGYATFRLRILLNDRDAGQTLALRLPTIFHAFELWIDGVSYARVGRVGTDRSGTVPSLATRQVYFQPRANQVELVLRVANFHHMRGGITKPIEIGAASVISDRTMLKTAYEGAVTASLFIIGIYHLLLYVQRRKDPATLWFGLFCLMWGVRSLLVGEVLLTRLLPSFPWGAQIKIEYLALYVGLHIFTLYFHHLFRDETPRWLLLSSRCLAVLFGGAVLLTPAAVFTRTLLVYEIIIVLHMLYFLYAIGKAWRRKKEGAAVFVAVSVVTFVSVLNDFLYYNELSSIANTSNLGLLIFTVAQMYLLSSRFTRAAAGEERAGRELALANERLQEANRNLEHKVAERTRELSLAYDDLRSAYDQLFQSEGGRKKMLSYLTHDLKAPLSSMIGYVEALQDNVKPENHAAYLSYVYDRAVWLNRMIEDLSLLSSLETGQISMNKAAVPVEPFIRQFWEKYELVLEEAGLHEEIHVNPAIGSGDPPIVHVDPVRLEQVLANLLSNAMKFTAPGGSIRLTLTIRDMDGPHAWICMSDTGIGIRQEHLEHIFERHFKRYPVGFGQENAGSGLGLAISKEIVELHDGKIWVESNGRDGSSFWIALPLAGEEAGPERRTLDEREPHSDR
jgi:signal transduction histidine kinase